jgi:ankyrin repeat protein
VVSRQEKTELNSTPKITESKKEALLHSCTIGDKNTVKNILSHEIGDMIASDYLECMQSAISGAKSVDARGFIVSELLWHSRYKPFLESIALNMQELWQYTRIGHMKSVFWRLSDPTKHSLLESAVRNTKLTFIVKYLLEGGVDPNAYGQDEPIFIVAVRLFNQEAIEYFLEYAPTRNNRARAINNNNGKRELDINGLTDGSKRTALHIAINGGDRNQVFERLTDLHASVTVTDADGRTPLHTAALLNKPWSIRLLLLQGADTDAKDAKGCTPIEIAEQMGHMEVTSQLKFPPYFLPARKNTHGSHSSDDDRMKGTVFSSADDRKTLEDSRQRASERSILIPAPPPGPALRPGIIVPERRTEGQEILSPSIDKPSPLVDLLYQLAANGNDNQHACKILKSYQGSNEWRDVLNTCLLEAAGGGNIRFMEDLVALGADLGPKVKASNGDTALHLAAKAGRRDMVKWLIERRVDLWATNNDGKTAKDCAERAGHMGCAISLRLAMPGERIGKAGWWDDIGDEIKDRLGAYDRPAPGGGADPTPMRQKPFVTAGPTGS